jgi:hypothetical protein
VITFNMYIMLPSILLITNVRYMVNGIITQLTIIDFISCHHAAGFLVHIVLVFCVVLLCVFTFCVLCCDGRNNFRIKTLFGSSLPTVICVCLRIVVTL